MSSLILNTLGPPRLLDPDGEPLQVGRLPLVLLAYFCIEERPLSRDHLGALLWPKSDRAHQRHNLRQAVLRLRKTAAADLLEGDGVLSVRPGSIRVDHTEFLRAIEEGETDRAVELWKGTFLDGIRRPESWELEDWIDQQRSRLENTLGAAVVAGARGHLGRGEPRAALALLEPTRHSLPYHDEIGALLVVALAGAGRVAEAEGVMSALDVDPSDLLVAEMVEALSQAAATELEPPPHWLGDGEETPSDERSSEDRSGDGPDHGSTIEAGPESAAEISDAPEPPAPAVEDHARRWPRIGHHSLAAVAVAVFLITISVLKGVNPVALEIASSQEGYVLMACTNWATGDTVYEPFRMGFDGGDKHRLATVELCRGVWVSEAETLFGGIEDEGGTSRLGRATPNPDNPIAEWTVSFVEAAEDLAEPHWIPGYPIVAPGGILLFTAENLAGNRDVYALETGPEILHRLTTHEAVEWTPAIDPAGESLVFTSYRTGGGDLYRMNLDGTGLERLTDDPLQDSRPWVRGDTVLFVRGRGEGDEDGNMELYLLDLRDRTEIRLTENEWNDLNARWSPTGQHICWQSEKSGHYEGDIEVMELATKTTRNVSSATGRNIKCFFTPDGDGVVFMGWRDGEAQEVFLVPVSGGEPWNLTRSPEEEDIIGWFELPLGLRRR